MNFIFKKTCLLTFPWTTVCFTLILSPEKKLTVFHIHSNEISEFTKRFYLKFFHLRNTMDIQTVTLNEPIIKIEFHVYSDDSVSLRLKK